MKRCKKCGELKPLTEFYAAKGMRDGRRSDCIACNREASRLRNAANPFPARQRVRRWQLENPERYRETQRRYIASGQKAIASRRSHLKRTAGITLEKYDEMLAAQGGGCAICGRPPSEKISLHVDHDHATGRIRGLLCFPCNNSIGLLYEDPQLVMMVAEYLVAHQEERVRERARSLVADRR